MSPSALRRAKRAGGGGRTRPQSSFVVDDDHTPLRLTLAYREPLAWDALLAALGRDVLPGVEVIQGQTYGRTVRLGKRVGSVFVRRTTTGARHRHHSQPSLAVELSPTLLPVLMPLLARLRHRFDLDAEPTVIDAHLEQAGLGSLVNVTPGLRLPGAFDGFEVALALLIRNASAPQPSVTATLQRVVDTLGHPLETVHPSLTHIAPTPHSVAEAGSLALENLGIHAEAARAIERVAHMILDGSVRLEPGSDVDATHRTLASIDGVSSHLAAAIVARTLQWPDTFPSSAPALQRKMCLSSDRELLVRAERWRPWRAYAALHVLGTTETLAPTLP